MSDRNRATERTRRTTAGFGYDPDASLHHFAVVADKLSVAIVERFARRDADDRGADEHGPVEAVKATLTRYLWDRIRAPAAAEFNRRLQAEGARKGAFGPGETLLPPHFGKELALLAWAVEDADPDPTPIPAMVANWTGLAPEERWWFYTTINAAAAAGRDRGWRKAIKIAFAENPVNLPPSALLVGPMPEPTRKQSRGRARKADEEDPGRGQLGLWNGETAS